MNEPIAVIQAGEWLAVYLEEYDPEIPYAELGFAVVPLEGDPPVAGKRVVLLRQAKGDYDEKLT